MRITCTLSLHNLIIMIIQREINVHILYMYDNAYPVPLNVNVTIGGLSVLFTATLKLAELCWPYV